MIQQSFSSTLIDHYQKRIIHNHDILGWQISYKLHQQSAWFILTQDENRWSSRSSFFQEISYIDLFYLLLFNLIRIYKNSGSSNNTNKLKHKDKTLIKWSWWFLIRNRNNYSLVLMNTYSRFIKSSSSIITKSITNSRFSWFHVFLYTIYCTKILFYQFIDYYILDFLKSSNFTPFRPKSIGSNLQLVILHICVPTETY